MKPRSDRPQQAAAPRRDVLGFSKSVVEFFTGMTGLAAASVGVLGTVLTIALTTGAFETPNSTGSTLDSSTGSTSDSSTATTSDSSTGTTSDSSTGTTSDSSTGSTSDSSGATSDSLIADMEATIQADLAGQLAETGEIVDSVSCARESDTRAHCTAAMSGTGPSSYSIGVDIDPTTGLYVWQIES